MQSRQHREGGDTGLMERDGEGEGRGSGRQGATGHAQSPQAKVYQFGRGRGGGMGGPEQIRVTPEEHRVVNPVIEALFRLGSTKTAAIQFLVQRGWPNSDICNKIRYDTDTEKHKAGDPLLVQHVSVVRTKFNERMKQRAAGMQVDDPNERIIQRAMEDAGLKVDVNPNRQSAAEASNEPGEVGDPGADNTDTKEPDENENENAGGGREREGEHEGNTQEPAGNETEGEHRGRRSH